MPELPEMENYVILLNERIAGQIITDVQVNREKSINLNPTLFINTIKQQKVLNISRRGKHLLFQLQNGQILLLHLMLGGWMFYGSEAEKPKRTVQIRLSFGLNHLYFIGLRLGYLHLYSQSEVEKELSHLGPEPLSNDFTVNDFLLRIKKKHGRLKTTILDQEFIAGIGNCYSAEICFHAKILPTKDIDDINEVGRSQLYQSMKFVLQEALKHGGYLENPFYNGDKLTGSFYKIRKVYDRKGEACTRCGAKIIEEMISSRKTFYCPDCQK
ncbi:DNA-formamidopyrimidine glycosylase [Neobacillus bataviensis]|uniref:DNA-formamidopyrimidine glycosylase n=1 Tax=Neobacillus bataviensis TaxID=220685 RepID=UPI001CBF540A|nr:DNA-formamidopyrimidine glycosylase [Neobacillus bataviensis]